MFLSSKDGKNYEATLVSDTGLYRLTPVNKVLPVNMEVLTKVKVLCHFSDHDFKRSTLNYLKRILPENKYMTEDNEIYDSCRPKTDFWNVDNHWQDPAGLFEAAGFVVERLEPFNHIFKIIGREYPYVWPEDLEYYR